MGADPEVLQTERGETVAIRNLSRYQLHNLVRATNSLVSAPDNPNDRNAFLSFLLLFLFLVINKFNGRSRNALCLKNLDDALPVRPLHSDFN